MTTVIGIKANYGIDGVVIATDRQLNHYDDAGKVVLKTEETRKISYGKKWIMAEAGGESNQFSVFQQSDQRLVKHSIARAVKRSLMDPPKHPNYQEINVFNTIGRRNEASLDSMIELVVAAKIKGKLGLWHVDEFGNVKESANELNYFTMGSGSDHVAGYVNCVSGRGEINTLKIDIPTAIDLAVEAIRIAEEDPNTSGLDLAVLTRGGVVYYGDFIQETMGRQKRHMIDTIKKGYFSHQ